MMRWKSLGLGAATFLVSHVAEAAMWSSWFAGNGFAPWFLNSARAAAFTAGALCLVAALAAARDTGEALLRGLNVGLGATAALVIVLVMVGPGTLFPIALAIGLAIVVTASVVGALAGAFLRGVANARRPHAPPS
jgi:hypothetical protein